MQLASGPKSRDQLRKVGITDLSLRQALKRMRDKGWAGDAVVLSERGKQAAKELADWVYENPEPRETPVDHLVEQVRQYKGVRWG